MPLPPPARLLSLATAVPPYELSQEAVRAAAATIFGGAESPFGRLHPVYDNAGIKTRHAVLPLEDLAQPRGWEDWHQLFRPAALGLLYDIDRSEQTDAGD